MTKTQIKKYNVKIGCFTYTVYFQKYDGADHGSTNLDNKEIFIDSTRSSQTKRETLFHELCHAAFDDCPSFKLDYNNPEDREEDLIRFLSPRMMQIFNDNAWLINYLFKGKEL